jgi:hypothetical protein
MSSYNYTSHRSSTVYTQKQRRIIDVTHRKFHVSQLVRK